MAAVIALTDSDDFGMQPCEEGVECRETARVGDDGLADDAGEHQLQSTGVGSGEAGIDVSISEHGPSGRVQIGQFELA